VALSQEHEVALLDLLVQAAYSTKKVATVLHTNMTDRLQLEAQRREETGRIMMSREAKEELAVINERITTELKRGCGEACEAEIAAATPAPAIAIATEGRCKGKAAVTFAAAVAKEDKADSGSKEGGQELVEPQAVSYHEVHQALKSAS
jgi:hypothetical protein